MSRRQTAQASAKPWVQWCASKIDDPVTRLKFLQSVTPLRTVRSCRRRWQYGVGVVLAAAILGSFLIARATSRPRAVAAAARAKLAPEISENSATPAVWMVESLVESETYSNGLRIDTRFETPYRPRTYVAFPLEPPDAPGTRRTLPAGIVFHTTESRQFPFEPQANGALKRAGESLVDFVRQRHAYHYLIDRFGRVYRIVPESDTADHAGYSVWSDADWLYLNLNESFLGVSFETKTEPGQEDPAVTPAQVHSAAMLTEMLRSRYGIAAANCVTHAQVSVNPDNMRIGYHTDWASSFPFAQLGLPDNYARPIPAIALFGFESDATFAGWAGTRLYRGVELAEQQLARDAAGKPLAQLRKFLRKRYRARLAEAMSGEIPAREGF